MMKIGQLRKTINVVNNSKIYTFSRLETEEGRELLVLDVNNKSIYLWYYGSPAWLLITTNPGYKKP